MTKTEMLFIRACKSNNPQLRLRSVYRRFYCSQHLIEDVSGPVAYLLVNIVEKYFKYSLINLLGDLSPSNIMYIISTPYNTKVLYEMTNIIRFTNGKDLPEGFIKPTRFRREDD